MSDIPFNDNSDKPWSLKGWRLRYKQTGPTTWRYQLVSPEGVPYGDLKYSDQYCRIDTGSGSVENLIRFVTLDKVTRLCLENYAAENTEPTYHKF